MGQSGRRSDREIALVEEHLPGNSAKIRLLLDLIERRPGRVLDVGCGDLSLWAALDDRPEVIGVDVELPPSRVPEIERLPASALELPFEGAEFDAVVSTQMLDDLRDRTQALREMARVLRRDGTLFLTCDAGETPRPLRARLQRIPRGPTLEELREEATTAGFAVDQLRRYGRHDLKRIQGELTGPERLRTMEHEESIGVDEPREWGLLYLRAHRT
jgi:SAM-dependent methyltransferase